MVGQSGGSKCARNLPLFVIPRLILRDGLGHGRHVFGVVEMCPPVSHTSNLAIACDLWAVYFDRLTCDYRLTKPSLIWERSG